MVIQRKYVALDAIRGVAAIAVVFFHGVSLFGDFMPRGYLAVDLFFVLSGFVIAHAYEARLAGGLSTREFLEARLIRFWPLYALGLALGLAREAALLISGNGFALPKLTLVGAALAGLFFLPFPLRARDGDMFPINVPSWSLFYELLVNILYSLVRPVLGTRVLFFSIFLLGGVFVACVPREGIGHVGVNINTFAEGCLRTILSFAIGVFIHRIEPKIPRLPLLFVLLLVVATLSYPFGGVAYDLAYVFLIAPILVTMGTRVKPSEQLATLAAWLGVISFPIYAIHRPLLGFAEAVAQRVTLPAAVVGWAIVAVLLLISAPLAGWYDAKVRRSITAYFRARRQSRETAMS